MGGHSDRAHADSGTPGERHRGAIVRTIRSECLDWLLIANTAHLERVLSVFIDHYNRHRAHRSLNLTPPSGTVTDDGAPELAKASGDSTGSSRRLVARISACCVSCREFMHPTRPHLSNRATGPSPTERHIHALAIAVKMNHDDDRPNRGRAARRRRSVR